MDRSPSACALTDRRADGAPFRYRIIMCFWVGRSDHRKFTAMATKMVTLKSKDGEDFVVEQDAAFLSDTIKNMIDGIVVHP